MSTGGQPYTTTLASDASKLFNTPVKAPDDIPSLALREVAEFLAGQTLTVDVETVSLALQYPRQNFSYISLSLCLTFSLFLAQKNLYSIRFFEKSEGARPYSFSCTSTAMSLVTCFIYPELAQF